MDDNNDNGVDYLVETENYMVYKTEDEENSGDFIYHIEMYNMTLHFYKEEWDEFLKEYFAISDENNATEIFENISSKEHFEISNVIKRNTKRNAPAPFITSTLQAEASRRLKMRPKQTMMLAQKLYEGVELGKEGFQGLITYMRTDSTRISEEILPVVRDFIKDNYGDEYLPEKPINHEKKNKANVQDAHEGIRPTSLQYPPESVKN